MRWAMLLMLLRNRRVLPAVGSGLDELQRIFIDGG
jgi:hypothetical protein